MLDVPSLESRWRRYKLKKIVPIAVLTTAVVVAIISITVVMTLNTHSNTQTTDPHVASVIPIKKELPAAAQNIVKKPQAKPTPEKPKNTQIVLHPSMQFIDAVGNAIASPLANTQPQEPVTQIQMPKHAPAKKQNKPQLQTVQSVSPRPSGSQTAATKVVITTTPVSKDMQEIIERFKQTNDPMLSLFLAKRYYQMKKYNLSYNYALITNQLDSTNDESWLLFAKSLVKLGQKKMAVNTLEAYIKNSDSKTAKSLLHDIQSGVFK
jgi:hypothetical protein